MKHSIKILAAIMLVAAMVLSIASCGGVDMNKMKGDWTVKTINGKTPAEFAASLNVDELNIQKNFKITDKELTIEYYDAAAGKVSTETGAVTVRANGIDAAIKAGTLGIMLKSDDTLAYSVIEAGTQYDYILSKGTYNFSSAASGTASAAPAEGVYSEEKYEEAKKSPVTTQDESGNAVPVVTMAPAAEGAKPRKVGKRPVKNSAGVIVYYEEYYIDEDTLAEAIGEAIVEDAVEDAIAEGIAEDIVEDAIAEDIAEDIVEDAVAEEVAEDVVGEAVGEAIAEEAFDEAASEDYSGGEDYSSEDYSGGEDYSSYDDGGYDDGGYDAGGYDDGGYEDYGGGDDYGGYDDYDE